MPVPFRELAGSDSEDHPTTYAVSLPLSSQEVENASAAQAVPLVGAVQEPESGAVAASY